MSNKAEGSHDGKGKLKKPTSKLVARYFLYFLLCLISLMIGSKHETNPQYELDANTTEIMSLDIYNLLESSTDVNIGTLLARSRPRFDSGEYKYHCSDYLSCFFHALSVKKPNNSALSNLITSDVIRPLEKCIRDFDNHSERLYNALPPCLVDLKIGKRFLEAGKNEFNAQHKESTVRDELGNIRQKLEQIQLGNSRKWIGVTTQRELDTVIDELKSIRGTMSNHGISCDAAKVTENLEECSMQLNLSVSKVSDNLNDIVASVESNTPELTGKRTPYATLSRSAIIAIAFTFFLWCVNFLFGMPAERTLVMSLIVS